MKLHYVHLYIQAMVSACYMNIQKAEGGGGLLDDYAPLPLEVLKTLLHVCGLVENQ